MLSERSLINPLLRKPSHIALAAILFWIVLYGIGYTKPNCCGEITDRCFQTSERAQCPPMVALRCRTAVPAQPQQRVFSVTRSSCCDPLDTCCKTQQDSPSTPVAVIVSRTPDSPDSSGPAGAIAADLDQPEIPEQKPAQMHRPIRRSKTPLYIQLRSILC